MSYYRTKKMADHYRSCSPDGVKRTPHRQWWEDYLRKHRQNFMALVQQRVEAAGGHPGKIDWETARYMYNHKSVSVDDVAERMIAIQEENEQEKHETTGL